MKKESQADYSKAPVSELDKEHEKPGTLNKLKNFFTRSSEEQKSPFLSKDDYAKKMQEENEKLDKMAEPDIRKQILSMIDKNINREYFNEQRLEPFFEKCWELKAPRDFVKENPRF